MRTISMRRLAASGLLPLLGLALTACSNSEDCEELASCGQYAGSGGSGGGASVGGAGGEGGQGGSGGTAPDCIPSEASDVVGAECGVFVSASLGDDANDGKQANPVATIERALAVAGGKPIYVCSEATPLGEVVLIEGAVEMYGGLDCGNGWVYDAAKPTRIATPTGKIPVSIKNVAGAVKLEDFDLAAADAEVAGGSSVGMFVAASSDVTLRRVSITAGKGVDGADGELVPFVFPSKAELSGNHAQNTNPDAGGMQKPCDCPAGDVTTGGAGGNEAATGNPGGNGAPDYGLGGGQGGTALVCNPSASTGSAAPDDAVQGDGADNPGAIDIIDGWVPASGSDGAHGKPGQGGGGGGAPPDTVGIGAGGGGACGGCGGKGGPGGQGGGASIAVLSLDSSVTAEGGKWTAVLAGAGGDADAGQAGQSTPADMGSAGSQTDDGCQGAKGGAGAAGAPGGGGAGGVSAAIVFKGTEPVIVGTERFFGAAVAPGGAGAGAGNNGAQGKSALVVDLDNPG